MTGTGSDLELQTFKLTDQITGRTLGIRADITPQAARIDAHQLRRDCPTRLCYLGTVLNSRGEGLVASRSPLQIGAELYGHSGVESELEILGLMLQSLQRAGIEEIYLDLGHVGIFRGLVRQAGLGPQREKALFDALQRKSVPELRTLVAGFDLPQRQGEMLVALAELSGENTLIHARERLSDAGDEVYQALDDLDRLAGLLTEHRSEIPVHYDLGELRGYHYHTGVVFAAFAPALGQEVARGGRYDDIGRLFGRARPACGFSADLKTLFRLGRQMDREQEPAIFAPSDDDPGLRRKIAALRSEGKQVVCALPGQAAGAGEMGCGERLRQQGGDWIVTTV